MLVMGFFCLRKIEHSSMANKPPKPFNIETLTQRLQPRLKKHLGYGNGTLSSSAKNINLNMQIPTS